MKKLPIMLLLLIMAALVLMTCGREGPVPPADKTPPSIKATIPADGTGNDGSLGFALDGSIVITFTKEMMASTINDQTVKVVPTGMNPIAGSVVYSNGSAIFTPAQPLLPGTTYTVTIDGSVQDIYGISMGSPFVFFFTTESLPDTTPPTILVTSPSATATDVAVNTSINVEFSEPVTASTLTFKLVNQSTMSAVTCTMNYTGSTTANFTPLFTPPAISLDGNTVYQATVKAGLKDLVGNEMVSDYTWTFTTGAGFDTTAPIVTATTPTAGATGVSATTYLMVTFNEPINETNAIITLFSTATGTPVVVPYVEDEYNYGTNTLSYKPPASVSLDYSTLYTARVSGIADLSGNPMPDMTWSFTTGKAGTSLNLYASDNHTSYGTPIAFTATVSSDATGSVGPPTGTVTFRDNDALIPNGTVALTGNTAIFTISNLALGTHTISATYNGDEIYSTSTASISQTVEQGSTMVVISAPSITYGSNGVVTVTVTSSSGIPVGDVSLTVDSGPTTTQALSNGSTVFTINKPAVGTHSLTAVYAGQGNFLGSTTDGTLNVGEGVTTTVISAPSVTYGSDGVVTVSVTSPSGTPTGSVSLDWETGSATQTLNASGSAIFTITRPNAGFYTLTASYQAQGSFLSSSAASGLTVNQAPTTMTMSAPAIAYGANGVVTITVASGILLPVGNVALVVDNSPIPTLGALGPGGPNGSAVVTFTITAPSAGSHSLSATYPYQPGTPNNFGPSSATGTLGVGQGATTMTLTFSSPITYGTNGVVTVSLTSASGTPTGSVSLSDTVSGGGTTTQTQQLSGGSTVFTIVNPIVGNHNLVATYTPQDNNFVGSSKTGTLTVSQAVTSTVITSSLNPSQFNNAVTFTATVSPATATGQVTFSDGAVVIGTGNLNNGVATLTTSALSVATHSITASYGGATYFAPSASTALTQIVNQASTTTTLTSSTNGQPVTPGTTVTFTATLNPAAATGTVTFSDNGVPFASGPVTVAAGKAVVSTNALTAGSHNITAVYSGDTNYATSTSNTVIQSVTNGSVTIGVVSSSPTSTYGISVTFTATVSGNGAVPTGTVTFKDGATTLGTSSLNGGSPDTATFSTAALVAGAHSITAVYNGDPNYSGNQVSSPITQNVIGTTSTSVVSLTPTSIYGNAVTFRATVSSTGGTPGGSVSFYDNAVLLGTGTLDNGSPDRATFTTTATALDAGVAHSITAVYTGSSYFAPSGSAPISQTVNQAPTTTSINAPSVSSGAHGMVYVTVSSGILLVTGNVSLYVDGSPTPLTGSLSSGVATFDIGIPSAGDHTLSASFAAQGNFGASSNTGTLTVGQATTTTSINAPAITYNANGSVTVSVVSSSGTPTGSVTLSVNGGTAMPQTLVNGSTTFTITAPNAGVYSLTASYAAQGNFGASSNNGSLTVNPASTTTNINAPAIAYGSDGTVTVSVLATGVTPTGNVSLSMDGGVYSASQLLSNGTTTFTIPTPSLGSHTLIATYALQGNFGASSNTVFNWNVGLTPTTTSINAPTITYGANGQATVTVSSTSGTPGGSVSLTVDGGGATYQGLNGSGSATFSLGILSAGTHTLFASYSAQGSYGASSSTQPMTVNKASTSTSVGSSPNPSTYGSSVTFTATVTPAAAPGSVTFMDGATSLGTVSLSGGTAQLSTSALSVGNHSITAVYGGDTNYSTSTSSVLTQTVNKTAPSVTITSQIPNPSTYGGSVTFTAKVTPAAASGTVTFMDGLSSLGTGSLSGGNATLSTSALTAGDHSITAVYNGDANYSTSTSAPVVQTVNKATPTVSVWPTATAIAYGQTLASSTLIGGSASVGGTFAFTTLSTMPPVGTTSQSVTFTPTDTNNYNTVTGSVSVTVNQASTTTTVTGPANNSTNGTLTFTATIAYTGSGVPASGTVTFVNSNTLATLCVANVSGSNASADCSIAAGSYSVVGTYSGDSNYAGSVSAAYPLTVL